MPIDPKSDQRTNAPTPKGFHVGQGTIHCGPYAVANKPTQPLADLLDGWNYVPVGLDRLLRAAGYTIPANPLLALELHQHIRARWVGKWISITEGGQQVNWARSILVVCPNGKDWCQTAICIRPVRVPYAVIRNARNWSENSDLQPIELNTCGTSACLLTMGYVPQLPDDEVSRET